jgi:hypothetical protein
MRTIHGAAAAAAAALAIAAAPAQAGAATPRNPHDPCASRGRDRCHTTGFGFYRTSAYGVRWYGDFSGAVAGEPHLFCVDLRFWYASPAYRYHRVSALDLRNRDGGLVPLDNRGRIAYAVWRFGRSSSPAQQAAVMLYVHSQMGDGRPGELDPAAAGANVAAIFRRISTLAARYAGPYRVDVRLPAKLRVGDQATATIRLLSASGAAVPNVPLSLDGTGTAGVAMHVVSGPRGSANVAVTPLDARWLRLRIRTGTVASTEPALYAPTTAAARANGQRLAAPASQTVTRTVTRTHVIAVPRLLAHVVPASVAVGSTVSDSVSVTGLGRTSALVQVRLWGPFASASAVHCSGAPMWSGSYTTPGDATTPTTAVRLDRAGYYGYRAWLAGKESVSRASTACGAAEQTTLATAAPALTTRISSSIVKPGASVFDRITVSGLGRMSARVEAQLYGPFGSRDAISCDSAHLLWSGHVDVTGNGTYPTHATALRRAGFYGFREEMAATPLMAGTETPCAPVEETALVAPEIITGHAVAHASPRATAAGSARPTHVRMATLGVDAPIVPSTIDLAHGTLGVPSDIHRTGWWRDGAAPGDASGTVLVAGHLDSAAGGVGAFFPLRRAHVGDRVELTTASGRTFAYRVVSVRVYPKRAVPTAIFSSTGSARLVLVTCGGPFDQATGHYADNVVVTAVPTTS